MKFKDNSFNESILFSLCSCIDIRSAESEFDSLCIWIDVLEHTLPSDLVKCGGRHITGIWAVMLCLPMTQHHSWTEWAFFFVTEFVFPKRLHWRWPTHSTISIGCLLFHCGVKKLIPKKCLEWKSKIGIYGVECSQRKTQLPNKI